MPCATCASLAVQKRAESLDTLPPSCWIERRGPGRATPGATSAAAQWDILECTVDYGTGTVRFLHNGAPAGPPVALAEQPALAPPLSPALALRSPARIEFQVPAPHSPLYPTNRSNEQEYEFPRIRIF